MTRHELLYILKSCSVIRRGPAGKNIGKGHRVESPLSRWVSKNGFYLRSKNKTITRHVCKTEV